MKDNDVRTLEDGLTPAHLGTTRRVDNTVGSLYTFVYRSRTATDPAPLILSVRRNGSRKWRARNGLTYMSGITLNNVSDTIKGLLIKKFYKERFITYKEMQKMRRFSPSLHYRIYDVRKVRNLHVVDASIYVSDL